MYTDLYFSKNNVLVYSIRSEYYTKLSLKYNTLKNIFTKNILEKNILNSILILSLI